MGVQEAGRVPLAHLLRQELLAKPEVCEDDVALGVKQHVLQLQISVDDTQLVGARAVLRLPPRHPHLLRLVPRHQDPARDKGSPLEKGSPVQQWAQAPGHQMAKAISDVKARKEDTMGTGPKAPEGRRACVKSPIARRPWEPRHEVSI